MRELSLTSVQIDGFRGLNGLRLDGLGRINVLVGPNNSGKTSVLEALSILCNPFEPFEWPAMVRRRDSGGQDETRIQSLRWCFARSALPVDPGTRFEGECTMACTGTFPVRKLRATYHEIEREPYAEEVRRRNRIPRPSDEDLVDFEPCLGAQIEHFVEVDESRKGSSQFDTRPIVMRLWEDQTARSTRNGLRGCHVRTVFLTPYSHQINRIQARYLSYTVLDHQRDLVVDLVQALDPGVESIHLASFRGRIAAVYVKHHRLGRAPLTIFGDAIRRTVLLANAIPALRDGGVLLIDGIEVGFHVNELQRVFAWLTKTGAILACRSSRRRTASKHSMRLPCQPRRATLIW